ncbi:MAG: thioredoxin-disulfide reductase [Candidatus Daviesbacteria bacterium]
MEKIIIVGCGPAGLSAAIYAARGGLVPLVISGEMPGGYPTMATDIEDYPGFPNGIKGPQLSQLLKTQAEKFGTRFESGKVVSVNLSAHPFKIRTEDKTHLAQTIILATGSNPSFLGIPSEQKLIGKGVSICATCDGPFFKGKKVVVIGGGDTALKESLYLSKIASELIIIHRRDAFRAQEALQKQIKEQKNVKFLLNSIVGEILGEQKVTGIKVEDIKTGKISQIKTDGVFIAIGHQPATQFLKGQIELDEQGFITVNDSVKTSVEGVFAAGDVVAPKHRQIVIAAGTGARAALEAEDYLSNLKS